MANWKKTTEELPNEKEVVIIKANDGIIECAEYVRKNHWEEVGTGSESFWDSQIEAWCRIPEYDLKQNK